MANRCLSNRYYKTLVKMFKKPPPDCSWSKEMKPLLEKLDLGRIPEYLTNGEPIYLKLECVQEEVEIYVINGMAISPSVRAVGKLLVKAEVPEIPPKWRRAGFLSFKRCNP